jgi:hypothetical protein
MLTPIISLDEVKSIAIFVISTLLSTLTATSPGFLNTADDRKRNGKQNVAAQNTWQRIDWVEMPHGNDQTPNTSFTVQVTIHLTNPVPHKILSHFTNTIHFYTSKFLTQKNLVPTLTLQPSIARKVSG